MVPEEAGSAEMRRPVPLVEEFTDSSEIVSGGVTAKGSLSIDQEDREDGETIPKKYATYTITKLKKMISRVTLTT